MAKFIPPPGAQRGSGAGLSLIAIAEYRQPATAVPSTLLGNIDIGAYKYLGEIMVDGFKAMHQIAPAAAVSSPGSTRSEHCNCPVMNRNHRRTPARADPRLRRCHSAARVR